MSADASSSSSRSTGAPQRRPVSNPPSSASAPKPSPPASGELRDPHPERLKTAATDDIDEAKISDKLDASLPSTSSGRLPGTDH